MSHSPVILLAEDEENVCIAIESILTKNFTCDVIIVKDGELAWEKLLNIHVDLVISDWNMPKKTGDQLLIEIRENKKICNTPFIMLTARSDKDSVVSALMSGVSSYISKPFNKNDIVSKVKQYLDIATKNSKTINIDLVKSNSEVEKNLDQAIDDFLKNPDFVVPVLSDVANEVITLISDNDTSVEKLTNIINRDPSLTAKLISTSNSITFMGNNVITKVQDAIVRLGLEETKNYVMMHLQKGMLNTTNPVFQKIVDKYWQHSYATAICAKEIAEHLGLPHQESYFTIGLLHDIGKLLLLKILLDFIEDGAEYEEKLVLNILSSKHEKTGAFLLKKWDFPSSFIEAATKHHNIRKGTHNSTAELVTNLADTLVRKLGYSMDEESDIELSKIISAKSLMIGTKELLTISQSIDEKISKMSASI